MEKQSVGRPSKYTDKLFTEICERLALGELLIDICEDSHMPDRRTVDNWMDANDKLFPIYLRAREKQQFSFADEMIKIAKDRTRDVIENTVETLALDGTVKKATTRSSDNTAVNRDALISKNLQFTMRTLGSRFFGDKVLNEHTGKDGAPLIPVIEIVQKAK